MAAASWESESLTAIDSRITIDSPALPSIKIGDKSTCPRGHANLFFVFLKKCGHCVNRTTLGLQTRHSPEALIQSHRRLERKSRTKPREFSRPTHPPPRLGVSCAPAGPPPRCFQIVLEYHSDTTGLLLDAHRDRARTAHPWQQPRRPPSKSVVSGRNCTGGERIKHGD